MTIHIPDVLHERFQKLFIQFVEDFLRTEEGRKHIASYAVNRRDAIQNFDVIKQKSESQQDITDDVLLKLLPHVNTVSNQEKGAWISIAPSINGNLKTWFENAGWAEPEDWPAISATLWEFIQKCVASPDQLKTACVAFEQSAYNTGFQAGMLTPILNALRPESFLIINNKSKKVINYFAQTDYSQKLIVYPELNNTGFAVIEAFTADIQRLVADDNLRIHDVFDAFCHWLNAIKKFDFSQPVVASDLALAEPFASLFTDRAEAEWAFDFIRDALIKLGIDDSENERISLTMPPSRGTPLHLNFGPWLIIGFYPPDGRPWRVRVPLLIDEAPSDFPVVNKFASQLQVCCYGLPIEELQNWPNELESNYNRALALIVEKFRTTKRSRYRNSHLPQLSAAVFDEAERDILLSVGFSPTEEASDVLDDDLPLLTPYDEAEFVERTNLSEEMAGELLQTLEDKRQLIFYGPPGTGKTYVARQLGRFLIGQHKPPSDLLQIVQFHPAYSYEDFIEGIRPQSKQVDGRHVVDYPFHDGIFYKFCQQAAEHGEPCVFIIDEINRGNIPQIFGELMLLLEYRQEKAILPYSGRSFSIPTNVHIIGTMNTADRSVALVDFALRRRFQFFRFGADPELFARWFEKQEDGLKSKLPYLPSLYRQLCTESIDDPNYAIGSSYFMDPSLDESKLERIWRRNIEPYLEEYHLAQSGQAREWHWDGKRVTQIRQAGS